MSLEFLYLWMVVMIIVLIAAPIVRKIRGKKPPNEKDFISSAFALGGAIALFRVGIKITTDRKLQADLDWDGTIALCISCGLGIYLSLKEVSKLLLGD